MSTKTNGVMFMADSLDMPNDFKPLGEFLADGPEFIPPTENEDLISRLEEPIEINVDMQTLKQAAGHVDENKTYLVTWVSPDGGRWSFPSKLTVDADGGLTFQPTIGPVNAETIVIKEKAEQR